MNGKVSNKVKLPSSLVMDETYTAFGKMLDGEYWLGPCIEYIND